MYKIVASSVTFIASQDGIIILLAMWHNISAKFEASGCYGLLLSVLKYTYRLYGSLELNSMFMTFYITRH